LNSSADAAAVGTLYVVATPIGNLEDITLRAIRILGEVALIASEDTRRTRKLLSHFDIHTPLTSYFREREASRSDALLEKLRQGKSVALVSDAGTPGISDPGHLLVRKAFAAGIPVTPIPGPSALSAILSVTPLAAAPFIFVGFLPASRPQRLQLFSSLAAEEKTMAFFEAPQRLRAAIADCLEVLGDRDVFLGRELTKINEELWSGTLAGLAPDLAARPRIKGECVVLVAGRPPAVDEVKTVDLHDILAWHRQQGELTLRDAVRKVANDLGLPRAEVYKAALLIWKEGTRE